MHDGNHSACNIIRAIVPGDGCPTLKDLLEAADMLHTSASRLISLGSSVVPQEPELLHG